MDVATITELGDHFPKARWFVPSGCKGFITSTLTTPDPDLVSELLWWEERSIGNTGVKVIFTPSQHWSARNVVFDSFSVS